MRLASHHSTRRTKARPSTTTSAASTAGRGRTEPGTERRRQHPWLVFVSTRRRAERGPCPEAARERCPLIEAVRCVLRDRGSANCTDCPDRIVRSERDEPPAQRGPHPFDAARNA